MVKVYGRLAIIALLIVVGVSLWYGRVEERLQGKNPVVKNEVAPSSMQKSVEPESVKTDYQIILTRNIFKAALELGEQPSGGQASADAEDLVETKMQLVLLGTVSGSKDDARAIIRNDKTKMEDIYHVGSELHGAIITRIGRGKVVLQVNGREEVLNIKETESGRGPQPVMQTGGARTTRPASAIVPQRRISFRNPTLAAPEPATPEPAASVPEDASVSLPPGEPEKQGDGQLVPNDEALSPESSTNENAGQPAQ